MDLNELYKTADFKIEKHAPVIEIVGDVKKGEIIQVNVCVGKEIPHPNTTEHHIEWIDLIILFDGEKFPFQIGRMYFSAHGASTAGPNSSNLFTEPSALFRYIAEKPGMLIAMSYCNIHGLWQSNAQLTLIK